VLERVPRCRDRSSAAVRAAQRQGVTITREELDEVVEKNDKQRFSFDEASARTRATPPRSTSSSSQSSRPPCWYHGTPSQNVPAIRVSGLLKMARHQVHLSADVETATRVGSRRGRAVVRTVESAAMHAAGVVFYRSGNGVWLCDTVEPRFIR